MVTIVTGKMNEGKTTAMRALHDRWGGDGFVSLKRMDGDKVLRFDAMRLADQTQKTLAIHVEHDTIGFSLGARLGPYRFSEATWRWINEQIDVMIDDGITPIYLDEIGMLELNGEGFHQALVKLVKAHHPLVFSVREDLLADVCKKYTLINPRTMRANEVESCMTSP